MGIHTDKHLNEEQLEGYAMNSLAEEESAGVEEHLLFCETCQDRLQAAERYVQAQQGAARRIRKEQAEEPVVPGVWDRVRGWFHQPAPVWAGAFAMVAIAMVAGLHFRPQGEPLATPVDVELQALRGTSSATAQAGHALNLRLDNRGIPESRTYEVEIVDEQGSQVWTGNGIWSGSLIKATVNKALKQGIYFVRLYQEDKEGHDPVREYELKVEKTPQ